MRFERMTFCSQSRHATAALYFVSLKRVGFEPTMRNSTDLQSAALNRSAIFSKKFLAFFLELFTSYLSFSATVVWVRIKYFSAHYEKPLFHFLDYPKTTSSGIC